MMTPLPIPSMVMQRQLVSGDDYVDLLAKAGFQNIEVVDVTDEYAATVEAWIREWGRRKRRYRASQRS